MRNTVVGSILVSILIAALPGAAKGPASATISGPGIEEPIELFDQNHQGQIMGEQIRRLMEQTGLWHATPSRERVDKPDRLGQPLILSWRCWCSWASLRSVS